MPTNPADKPRDPDQVKARAIRNAVRATTKVLDAERAEAAAYAYARHCGASLRELAEATGRPHMTVKRISQRTETDDGGHT